MSTILATYLVHPTTGEEGWWALLSGRGLVGAALSQWPAIPTGGSAAARLAKYKTDSGAALAAQLANGCTVEVFVTGLSPLTFDRALGAIEVRNP